MWLPHNNLLPCQRTLPGPHASRARESDLQEAGALEWDEHAILCFVGNGVRERASFVQDGVAGCVPIPVAN
eukprot:6311530-Pyramimonas_sp.AAC.1